jgi:Uma2 family endonuclease
LIVFHGKVAPADPFARASILQRPAAIAYNLYTVNTMTTTTIATSTGSLTADDLWQLSNDGRRRELVNGAITMMAPAGGAHAAIAGALAVALGHYVKAKQLGIVLVAEPGFVLSRNPDTVRAPDAAFIAQSRVPAKGMPVKFIEFPPDIAVEVLSPSDAQIEVEDKIQQWLDAGTKLVWIVNPSRKTVTIHKAAADPRVLHETDTLSGEDVCPGFSVNIAEIFT